MQGTQPAAAGLSRKKRLALFTAAAVVLLVALGLAAFFVAARQRAARHRVFRAAPVEVKTKALASAEMRPVAEWTEQFRLLEASGRWADLSTLLVKIEREHLDLYQRWSLGYLHARALIESNEMAAAGKRLAPYLAPGHPFRDLALSHQAEIDEGRGDHAAASRDRQQLIFQATHSTDRNAAIDDEIEFLSHSGNLRGLTDFAARISPSADTRRRRDLSARTLELLVRAGNRADAVARGMILLQGGTLDDASDRAARILDHPEAIRSMDVNQLAILGETMRNHRHFDRAIALLTLALQKGGSPTERPDDLLFAIGRSQFGNEDYGAALQTYMRGASSTRDPKWKATFLFHASRATQLQGDDAGAERLMTAVLSVPGRYPATSSALTQRLRTRIKQRRVAEAGADLNALRGGWPKDHAVYDGSLAYAIGLIGAGNRGGGLSALNSIPRGLMDPYEVSEIEYWRARALEASNPTASFGAYLNVLRAPVSTHFAYFARERLDAADMKPRLQKELATRDAEVARLVAAGNWDLARRVATDRILLSSENRQAELKRLAEIYQHLPSYAAVLNLRAEPFPSFPLGTSVAAADLVPARPQALMQSAMLLPATKPRVVQKKPASKTHAAGKGKPKAKTQPAGVARGKKAPAGPVRIANLKPAPVPQPPGPDLGARTTLLMAMGLFDEAADQIPKRYGLRPLSSALTQSLALNQGNASRDSIYAIEVMMSAVPRDFVPELLPRTVKQLLYPRYFFDSIEQDSRKFGADPYLVLSIMREESRFNPRAKSEAAARGLLQFIITTARDIGREVGIVEVSPDDLYDPRIIIRLGAKYISTLSQRFHDDHYNVAGAYNAGPNQVALWSRLAPGAGDDFYLSSVNFDETKHYIRKVMNSYRRYREIYGNGAPAGGLRAEP